METYVSMLLEWIHDPEYTVVYAGFDLKKANIVLKEACDKIKHPFVGASIQKWVDDIKVETLELEDLIGTA